VYAGENLLGVFGELHPQVKAQYDFLSPAVLAADFDLAALTAASTNHYNVSAIPVFPATLEDIAVIVDETVPAGEVEALICQTGGKLLREVRLFDIFRSEQIGAGKKSLAYSLTYQAADHTLSAKEAEQIRHKIVKRLEFALGAKLRTA
jgi:phenylalanyl-tRNA synthetase beta chain